MELVIAQDMVERMEAREFILTLQERMSKLSDVKSAADYKLRHFFSDGWYMREITVPAGEVIIGKIHKHAHTNCVSIGKVRVFTEFGADEMYAPFQFVSEPGTKRVVLTLEETVWTTYHANPTNTQDLAELEAQIIAKDYKELEQHDLGSIGSSSDSAGRLGGGREGERHSEEDQ
jgi:aminopeptidase-like protein